MAKRDVTKGRIIMFYGPVTLDDGSDVTPADKAWAPSPAGQAKRVGYDKGDVRSVTLTSGGSSTTYHLQAKETHFATRSDAGGYAAVSVSTSGGTTTLTGTDAAKWSFASTAGAMAYTTNASFDDSSDTNDVQYLEDAGDSTPTRTGTTATLPVSLIFDSDNPWHRVLTAKHTLNFAFFPEGPAEGNRVMKGRCLLDRSSTREASESVLSLTLKVQGGYTEGSITAADLIGIS